MFKIPTVGALEGGGNMLVFSKRELCVSCKVSPAAFLNSYTVGEGGGRAI